MGHTNSTSNYNLPQFITTDKPAWLTDVNNAYSAIDFGIHAAKTAADNAQGDATTALTNAGTAQTKANTADSKASGAIASISEDFLDSATYAVGDLVMYNNLLYKCHTAVVTPGAWTGSSNWSRTDIDTIINNLALDDLADVTFGTPQGGQVLEYDGYVWKNNNLTKDESVSPVTGYTLVYNSSGINNKIVNLNAAFEKTGGFATGWQVVGNVSHAPAASVYCPVWNITNGGPLGMARIDTDGSINCYITASGNIRAQIGLTYHT